MSIITEDYYLCERIYLKANEKKLIDENNNDKLLEIRNINDKITIFEREVKEWIIHPMWTLLRNDLIIDKIIMLLILNINLLKMLFLFYLGFFLI